MTQMRKSMPVVDWPIVDHEMWDDLVRAGGLFDDHGALSRLRPSTMRNLTQSWGRFLEWLRLHDPASLTEPPIDRATLPRILAWLEAECNLSPTSRLMFFSGVLRLLCAAAPESDWSAHRRIKIGLGRLAGRGDLSRKAGRILDSRVLLEAALRHAGSELGQEATALQRAKRLRDAAMVALLAMMPIRHRAFARLQLGASLIVNNQTLTILLPGELTKTGTLWEAELPEPAAGLLRRYLSDARPYLLARNDKGHDMLWACDNGNPMSYSYVGRRIPQITQVLTGKAIPPHFFRDAAATTLARTSQKAAQLISPVLGHADCRTAARHYIHAGTIEASRDFAALLRQLKKEK